MMNRIPGFAIALAILLLGTQRLTAQPYGAMDEHCYLPNIGESGVIDTIMGGYGSQELGDDVFTLPPRPGSAFGDVAIAGVDHPREVDRLYFATVAGGPDFNLRRYQNPRRIQMLKGYSKAEFGHFRDREHLDLFAVHSGMNRIYWESDEGIYDTLNYTDLGRVFNTFGVVYFGHLTSDTLDDIIVSDLKYRTSALSDVRLNLFRGGAQLAMKSLAEADSSINVGYIETGKFNDIHYGFCFGDFRGVGRNDLITLDDTGNMFVFRNTKPFTMEKLREGWTDTLFSVYENPLLHPHELSRADHALAFRAFPKKPGDSSVDLAVNYGMIGDGFSIQLFPGGPDFGSHRLIIDRDAFVIPNPGSDYNFGESLTDCGDMTGSGDRVLCVQGAGSQTINTYNFYVTGKALDKKIDMYFDLESDTYATLDTVTADGDRLEDVVIGVSGFPRTGPLFRGAVLVVHGSRNIPHTKSLVATDPNSGAAADVRPTPFTDRMTVRINKPIDEPLEFELRNVVGDQQFHTILPAASSGAEFNLSLPVLPPGAYLALLHNTHFSFSKMCVRN